MPALMCDGSEAWSAPVSCSPCLVRAAGQWSFRAQVLLGSHSRWRHCTMLRLLKLPDLPPLSKLRQGSWEKDPPWCLPVERLGRDLL